MQPSDFTAPCPCETERRNRTFSIGLPRCSNPSERRFPLTPEAVEILVERGFTVKIESGAAESINYPDQAYQRCGAIVGDRTQALLCDIVIHLAPLETADLRTMRRGAMLLTLLHLEFQTEKIITTLLDRGIIAIALDLITDESGNQPFADILSEIDGRAAIPLAAALLADGNRGKGILLGGVSGIVPCEVLIIGSGIAAVAAARSAIGLGATVRMYDNDVYRLRTASRELGPGVITSALHPGVVARALHSADIVITSDTRRQPIFDASAVDKMKKGVITFDLSQLEGASFPTMPTVNLALAKATDNTPDGHSRVCYIHSGSAVPRTAAMALSNTFVVTLEDIITLEGMTTALKLIPGLQRAAYTFLGKVVNADVAKKVGMHHVDISLFLHLS